MAERSWPTSVALVTTERGTPRTWTSTPEIDECPTGPPEPAGPVASLAMRSIASAPDPSTTQIPPSEGSVVAVTPSSSTTTVMPSATSVEAPGVTSLARLGSIPCCARRSPTDPLIVGTARG